MDKKIFLVSGILVAGFILSQSSMAFACGPGCGGGCGAKASCSQEACTNDATSSATLATAPSAVNVGNTICPVMGEEIKEETKATYEYAGKIYNFCCPGCIAEFQKDPRKYIKKVNLEQSQG